MPGTERMQPYRPPVTDEKIARALDVPDIGVHGVAKAMEITRGTAKIPAETPKEEATIEEAVRYE